MNISGNGGISGTPNLCDYKKLVFNLRLSGQRRWFQRTNISSNSDSGVSGTPNLNIGGNGGISGTPNKY